MQSPCTSYGGFTTVDSGLREFLLYPTKLCRDRQHSTHMDSSLDAAHTAVPKRCEGAVNENSSRDGTYSSAGRGDLYSARLHREKLHAGLWAVSGCALRLSHHRLGLHGEDPSFARDLCAHACGR